MSATNGNGAPKPLAGRPEARAEYEEKTKSLLFTKHFNSALEAVMQDRLATSGQRFLAWLERYSWGEYSLYAIGPDGLPRFQVDAARELAIDKRNLTHVVAYYVQRGFVRVEGKVLYLVIAPQLGPAPEKVARSSDFSEFLETWKVAHSSDFSALEVARSTVERIRKVILSDYKKSRASATTVGPILIEEKRQIKKESPPPPPLSLPSEKKAEEEDGYSDFKRLYPKSRCDDAKAKTAFRKLSGNARQDALAGLRTHLESERWIRSLSENNGKFIPLASKFLNDKQYAADPPPYIEVHGNGETASGVGKPPPGESSLAKKWRERQEYDARHPR